MKLHEKILAVEHDQHASEELSDTDDSDVDSNAHVPDWDGGEISGI